MPHEQIQSIAKGEIYFSIEDIGHQLEGKLHVHSALMV